MGFLALICFIKHMVLSFVVTQPDKKVGRRGDIEYSPVKKYALKHNIPFSNPLKCAMIIKQSWMPIPT